MSKQWPLVPLGEVLTKSEEWIDLDPQLKYRELTVRLWGKGVTLRREVSGAEISASRRLQVKAGQFILSRIDARNGAFGLVPDSLDGAVVSNDFPVFTPNPSRLFPAFLGWMARTRDFIDLCKAASEGTTNRVRLQENRFLAMRIPLPSLSEQHRIVARIEEMAAKIEEARNLRLEVLKEAKALTISARRSFFGEKPSTGWIPLSQLVAEIENGKSPQCESRPANGDEWGVLKVGAVSFGSFDGRENKALPIGLRFNPRHEVCSGDFLMSRANTTELVGACAIVKHTRRRLLLSDKTFRFHFRCDVTCSPRWLDHAMKSPALRAQIERGASGTSPTMKNISKEKVLGLLLPPHSPPKQRRIVTEMDALEAYVDALTKLQADTAVELDAMLPSILDKGFKGEL